MSGMDIIGIATTIVTVLSGCVEVIEAADDASGLPPAFRDASARLPLIQESFSLAGQGLDVNNTAESLIPLKRVLDAAEMKALTLHNLFKTIAPQVGASRVRRYLQAPKVISKADQVEKLVEGILRDLQVLTANYVIKGAVSVKITENLDQINGNLHQTRPKVSFNNMGSGNQYIHYGVGDQCVATGTAFQINGVNNGGVFNFIQK
ncbi:unnamed protein product [Clonostachys rosea]|uniref:NACHT-NTPase and P-loop NTPases N-terminal domain-containing protein n=1 Tax=Bionectria ochroleuca TaxID=29856 RepID=A0ABY6UT38_BIOOC|nr:unnamed protein product [Clonostachys rosea]